MCCSNIRLVQAEQLMRDFDSIAAGLQANLTSKGCLDKDVSTDVHCHLIQLKVLAEATVSGSSDDSFL